MIKINLRYRLCYIILIGACQLRNVHPPKIDYSIYLGKWLCAKSCSLTEMKMWETFCPISLEKKCRWESEHFNELAKNIIRKLSDKTIL